MTTDNNQELIDDIVKAMYATASGALDVGVLIDVEATAKNIEEKHFSALKAENERLKTENLTGLSQSWLWQPELWRLWNQVARTDKRWMVSRFGIRCAK